MAFHLGTGEKWSADKFDLNSGAGPGRVVPVEGSRCRPAQLGISISTKGGGRKMETGGGKGGRNRIVEKVVDPMLCW